MGRRGPAPEPTRLTVLRGGSKITHRPLPVGEPTPDPRIPSCPAWLPAEARRGWRYTAPMLHRSGLLTSIDGLTLAGLCIAVWQLRKALVVIEEKGQTFTTPSGYRQQRPEVAIMNRSLDHIKQFGDRFGLSPSARARISLGEKPDEGDAAGVLS